MSIIAANEGRKTIIDLTKLQDQSALSHVSRVDLFKPC